MGGVVLVGPERHRIHSARATAWLRVRVSSSRVRVLGGVKLAMRACGRAGVRARLLG